LPKNGLRSERFKKIIKPKAIYFAFGDRVREERIKSSLTQVELAEYLGVSDDTIIRIESGETVKLDLAYNIAIVLGKPLQYFLQGEVMSDENILEDIQEKISMLQLLFEKLKKKFN